MLFSFGSRSHALFPRLLCSFIHSFLHSFIHSFIKCSLENLTFPGPVLVIIDRNKVSVVVSTS